MTRESEIEAKIVRHCHSRSLICYKFSSPAHRGVPDRLIMGPGGKAMFMEVKAPGKKPTALQAREIARLNALGILAVWVDNYQAAVERIDDHFAEDLV